MFVPLLLPTLGLLFVQAFAAENYDPEFSIGLRQPISSDGWSINNYQTLGINQVLRDRVILTPIHPGSQRAAIWSDFANPYNEWTAEIEFRANGEERAGGSFHFWYSQGGAAKHGTDSVYTSKPWDGLAILIDKYGNYGGSVRGFLNDGKTDYSIHHNIHSLSFAHCDFVYRNLGQPSKLTIKHTYNGLRVETDGRVCFETHEVRLPSGYHFGISAASADAPDSFELFSFKLSSSERDGHHDIHAQQQHTEHKSQETIQEEAKKAEKDFHGKLPHEEDFQDFKEDIPDKPASVYKTQEEQFTDLHDRLQALTHHLAAVQVQIGQVYDKVDATNHRLDDFRSEDRHTRVPREQVDKMEAKLVAIDGMLRELERVMHTKDYTAHFDSIHNALRDQHSNLLYAVPDSVAQAIHTTGPRINFGIGLLLLVQGSLVVSYVVYKRRRASLPKKYL